MDTHNLAKNLEYGEILKFFQEHSSSIKNFKVSKKILSFEFLLYPYDFQKEVKQLADLLFFMPHDYVTTHFKSGPILIISIKRIANGSDFADCLLQLNLENNL